MQPRTYPKTCGTARPSAATKLWHGHLARVFTGSGSGATPGSDGFGIASRFGRSPLHGLDVRIS